MGGLRVIEVSWLLAFFGLGFIAGCITEWYLLCNQGFHFHFYLDNLIGVVEDCEEEEPEELPPDNHIEIA
ncbi:hypothetical protein [Archaeoglobus veneficus]|uniref:Other/FunK1 protein kinase n=1 Tax=Archaeoglobus veneficus (strain DSM 11195 / SNP6) TaxID=693661 RepID=F2KR41_ARCVS|nr:hypothetical protein [Archaeoglobus veneficus]AEA46678.1 other/FunK1 protein kinase [Archaeoglobus veneficus SNP6]